MTVPEAVTISPVSEVAPASVQVEPCSTVSVPLITVITGAVVSTTGSPFESFISIMSGLAKFPIFPPGVITALVSLFSYVTAALAS